MSDRYLKVEGYPNLVRDVQTGVILNTNKSEIEQARLLKKKRQEKKREDLEMKDRIENLESGLSEIQNSLDLILKKLS